MQPRKGFEYVVDYRSKFWSGPTLSILGVCNHRKVLNTLADYRFKFWSGPAPSMLGVCNHGKVLNTLAGIPERIFLKKLILKK